jgi:hypothetical protein
VRGRRLLRRLLVLLFFVFLLLVLFFVLLLLVLAVLALLLRLEIVVRLDLTLDRADGLLHQDHRLLVKRRGRILRLFELFLSALERRKRGREALRPSRRLGRRDGILRHDGGERRGEDESRELPRIEGEADRAGHGASS